MRLTAFFGVLLFVLGDGRRSAIERHRFDDAGRKFHFHEAIFFGNPDALGLQVRHLAAPGVALRMRNQIAGQRAFARKFTTSCHNIYLVQITA